MNNFTPDSQWRAQVTYRARSRTLNTRCSTSPNHTYLPTPSRRAHRETPTVALQNAVTLITHHPRAHRTAYVYISTGTRSPTCRRQIVEGSHPVPVAPASPLTKCPLINTHTGKLPPLSSVWASGTVGVGGVAAPRPISLCLAAGPCQWAMLIIIIIVVVVV